MKKYISTLVVGLALMTIASCSKDTEGLTGITYYPVIELAGPINDLAVAGTPFVDPGYSALLNGEDYTSEVVVSTDMDVNNPVPGYYSIIYSATNADGFSTSAVRYVLVVENDDPVSGYYTTNPDSFRDYSGFVYYGGYPVIIYANGDGTYHISDLLAGWYEYRAGYGSDYALEGEISVADDGTIELLDSFIVGWGDSANELTDGIFDKDAGTIKYIVSYTDNPLIFNVTLDKN